MSTPTKFLLDESKMPKHWYNIARRPAGGRAAATASRHHAAGGA